MIPNQIKDSTRGMVTKCLECWKHGILTSVYNEGYKTKQSLYCEKCKRKRILHSIQKSKERAKLMKGRGRV